MAIIKEKITTPAKLRAQDMSPLVLRYPKLEFEVSVEIDML